MGRFLADESGATALEYSLVAGILLVVVAGIASTGGALAALYAEVGALSAALGGT